MKYTELCKVYLELEATSKGLEKTTITATFLENIKEEPGVIYLLQGRIFPDWDERETGISQQLVIKAVSRASGASTEEVVEGFRELGELGLVAEKLMDVRKQSALFSKKLTVDKVMSNLRKLPELVGKGTVDRKMGLIVELLNSASGVEAKYIIRTLMGDLKVGIGSGILRDAIVEYCFSPKDIAEKKEKAEIVQEAYDKATDFALVFEKACAGKLKDISLSPGKPVKVMLFPKAKDVEDAFRIVGKPAAFEYKYDGFRVMINKDEKGEIKVFTRRLDNVTKQFPDIVEFVKNVKAKSFILDAEVVGYDPKEKKYKPFQYISQRIRRKYEIERLVRELPIELTVFDIIYYNGKSLINAEFKKRWKIIEKIIKEERWKITLADQIITDDEKEVEEFYQKALDDGQEGLMGKNLSARYKPGARVGHAVKLKPDDDDFDLVITGAEWGTGKRAGWLTSFDVSCRDGDELKDIGKVSTGLKEKKEEGLSFEEMTELLKPLVISEKGRKVEVRPEVVVTVRYQNIQKSPTYSSGYALRFPRIVGLRPDRGVGDVAAVGEVAKEIE